MKFTPFFSFHKEVGSSKIIFATSIKGAKTFVRYAKATEAILESYSAITNALSHLHSNVSEKSDTRLHANNLLQKMKKLEFVFMLNFCSRVLGRFQRVSKVLQKSGLLLSACAELNKFTCRLSKRNER